MNEQELAQIEARIARDLATALERNPDATADQIGTYVHRDEARALCAEVRRLRAALTDAIKEQEAAEERARWAAHDRDRGTAS